jgi:hypothetical protein
LSCRRPGIVDSLPSLDLDLAEGLEIGPEDVDPNAVAQTVEVESVEGEFRSQ